MKEPAGEQFDKITVSIFHSQKEKMLALANERGVSYGKIVREALSKYFEKLSEATPSAG